jgi:hypothetical protein
VQIFASILEFGTSKINGSTFMKMYSVVLALFLALGVVSQADAQFGRQRNNREANREADQVCVYTDSYFQGSEQCFQPGEESSNLGHNISSIRVSGRARVTVFEGKNFTGNAKDFASDTTDLVRVSMSGSKTWNDRISSLRVTSDNAGYQNGRDDRRAGDLPGRRRGQQRQNTQEVCVYENANYQGASQCFTSGEEVENLSSLRSLGNRISSVRVYGQARAVLFQNAGFQGARLVVDHDIPDLARIRMRGNSNWNDRASSIEVDGGRSYQDGRLSSRR